MSCQQVSSNWNQAALVWTIAPSLTPSSGEKLTVTYDGNWDGTASWPNGHPSTSTIWVHWPGDLLSGDFSAARAFGLASTNETGSAWAYFAKKELSADLAPRLTPAWDRDPLVQSLQLGASSLGYNQSTTATITLGSAAPSGGYRVYLGCTDPNALALEYQGNAITQIVVPASATTVQFTVRRKGNPGMAGVTEWVFAGQLASLITP